MDCSPLGFSVGVFGQEYHSGLPFPPLGDLPDPGTEPESPASPALTGRFFTTEPPGFQERRFLPCGPLLGGSVRRALHFRKGNIKIYVPKTSLSSPPWTEVVLPDPVEEARHHAEVVEKVNELIARGQYGRLFAVVHFASHQWKVTSEDLILIENKLDIACGERIRLEKVLLVGADDFTLLGRPLLGKDLVRVEATVIEKTESWPRVNMRFQRRKNYKRKRIIVNPQTVLRINTIEIAPCLC
ncbi:39S ribosomal protein L21, mitochondrial isoform X1 [Cervus canadensis]|uniref:39S ribosomal protein L21, mitochondrial isoform X1 n=1 Tax=Cervus canadensis TaxID=1574408 RepID=UPI001CA3828B|nr:39S ribosomal protein L21, mitochondrial isoform X1 [Cervus canadensis]